MRATGNPPSKVQNNGTRQLYAEWWEIASFFVKRQMFNVKRQTWITSDI